MGATPLGACPKSARDAMRPVFTPYVFPNAAMPYGTTYSPYYFYSASAQPPTAGANPCTGTPGRLAGRGCHGAALSECRLHTMPGICQSRALLPALPCRSLVHLHASLGDHLSRAEQAGAGAQPCVHRPVQVRWAGPYRAGCARACGLPAAPAAAHTRLPVPPPPPPPSPFPPAETCPRLEPSSSVCYSRTRASGAPWRAPAASARALPRPAPAAGWWTSCAAPLSQTSRSAPRTSAQPTAPCSQTTDTVSGAGGAGGRCSDAACASG